MTAPPPAGWYPDPSGGTGLRWWNGQGWSEHTSAAPTAPGVPGVATGQDAGFAVPTPGDSSPPPYGSAPSGHPASLQRRRASGFAASTGNRYALITFGVVAIYLVLAFSTRIVFIGIFPVLMALRSRQAREPLAFLAIGAAVVAVIVAVAVLTGH